MLKGRPGCPIALVLSLKKIKDIFKKYSEYQNEVEVRGCKTLGPFWPHQTLFLRIDENNEN